MTQNTYPGSQSARTPNASGNGLDFAAEDKHWRDHYKHESYYSADHGYDDQTKYQISLHE